MIENPFLYEINCVSSEGEWIQNMCDQEKGITWRTFIKHVPVEEVRQVFPYYSYRREIYNSEGELTSPFHIKDDWAVQFCKSIYCGRPCYFIRHSGIEYIFTQEGGRT